MSRSRIFLIAVILPVALALGFLAWAVPRWTRADRARLALATSAPWQKAHLIDTKDTTPSHYYVDMRPIAEAVRRGDYRDEPFDESGIPLADYVKAKAYGMTERAAYNPITIAQYGLGRYEEYLHGDKSGRADFLKQAEWLRDHLEADGSLPFDFAIPTRKLTPPWVSAMAQGEAMSVFVRAYVETGDRVWLDAAQSALQPFARDISHGGVTAPDEEAPKSALQEAWLEEYPADPPSHVLNGAIFAAFGLRDAARIADDGGAGSIEWPLAEAGTAFEISTETMSRHLGEYELDGWVRYQLTGDVYATKTYYGLQIEQLKALDALTGNATFAKYAEEWSYPLDHPQLWLAGRTWERFKQRAQARF